MDGRSTDMAAAVTDALVEVRRATAAVTATVAPAAVVLAVHAVPGHDRGATENTEILATESAEYTFRAIRG